MKLLIMLEIHKLATIHNLLLLMIQPLQQGNEATSSLPVVVPKKPIQKPQRGATIRKVDKVVQPSDDAQPVKQTQISRRG